MSKAFLEPGHDEPPPPVLRPLRVLRDELNVDLRLGAAATGLDPRERVVYQGERAVPFDHLIIAIGARARRLPQGQNLAGVHLFRTLDDARAVRRALDAGGNLVVVGAGFIGSEVASSAARRGMSVTIVEAAPNPLQRAMGPEVGTAVAALHDRNGTSQPYSAVPYFWSDLYGQRIQFVGRPTADEVRFVDGGPGAARWVALYRRGERLIAAAAQNGQPVIMKYRALIAARASWPQALDYAAESSSRTTGRVGVD